MTEEEAKVKWCPFTRWIGTAEGHPAGNRWDAGDGSAKGSAAELACRCIGSSCMAWRWKRASGPPDKIAAIKEYRRVNPGADLLAAKNAVEAQWTDGKPMGFCGLAGSPL